MSLAYERFIFKELFTSNLSRGHTEHWLGHCKELTLSPRFKFIPLTERLFIYWRWYTRVTVCVEVKRQPADIGFLFLPYGSLGSNVGCQGGNKDLYSLGHLSSPIHLVLEAMKCHRGKKPEPWSGLL